ALVPRPSAAVFAAMRESVRADGVLTPIDVRRGDLMIFDGFTRAEIALLESTALVPVRFHDIQLEADLSERTILAAVHRRQLSVWELVRVGYRLLSVEKERAAERMRSGRRAGNP